MADNSIEQKTESSYKIRNSIITLLLLFVAYFAFMLASIFLIAIFLMGMVSEGTIMFIAYAPYILILIFVALAGRMVYKKRKLKGLLIEIIIPFLIFLIVIIGLGSNMFNILR